MKSIAIGAIGGGISGGSDMLAEGFGKMVEGGAKITRKIATSALFNLSVSAVNNRQNKRIFKLLKQRDLVLCKEPCL